MSKEHETKLSYLQSVADAARAVLDFEWTPAHTRLVPGKAPKEWLALKEALDGQSPVDRERQRLAAAAVAYDAAVSDPKLIPTALHKLHEACLAYAATALATEAGKDGNG